MTEHHKVGQDGILEDGVSFRPATQADIETYRHAEQQLATMRTPRFLPAGDANARLFVACFDGTGNDMRHDPEHATAVARVWQDVEDARRRDPRIGSGYVEGIGTQSNAVIRLADGAVGFTYDDRIERMYRLLIEKAAQWKAENPNVEIRIADLGFSRGAEEAAAFARVVHERGIQDPRGFRHEGSELHYTAPPLVPPGRVPQALDLIDPVGTGMPRLSDRRPPASVMTGFQIVAADERRNLFQSTSILDPGATADGRFLSVTVAGAHSNAGDSYHHDGLGTLSYNLVVDSLNGLSDTSLAQKRDLPADPGRYVIHRSEEGAFFYRTSVFDRHGERGRVDELAPRGTPGDRFNAEPRDDALAARFEFRPVAIGPVPAALQTKTQADVAPRSETESLRPADATLRAQALDGVHRLDAQFGRTPDAISERVAAALLPVAREAGLERIDRVVRSDDGRYLFAVQGELTSPTNRWARVDAAVAANTPVETSLQALRTLSAELDRRRDTARDTPDRVAPQQAQPAPVRTIGAL
ncbi:XVIPCD domain-containing protein [Cognatilysobacter terrigena]|uniref:XVIPCD domain-containing protein n=1 Tax=Cognatilysobacter terrigena TaxID=2488749 RepID=UPI00105D0257|nr:XVIPCD domain-containing protein [Lysobacter terrigena]